MKYNLLGHRFGQLTVVALAGRRRASLLWECKCDCGNTSFVISNKLVSGRQKGCGCLIGKATHGHARNANPSPSYSSWKAMVSRCEHQSNPAYKHYCKRGITVCKRWRESFEAFLADVGERPSPSHTLDRIDNDKGYAPGNCRWATRKEQANNRTTNIWFEHEGQKVTFQQLVDKTGMPKDLLRHRLLRAKWPLDKALSLPPRPGYRTDKTPIV